MRAIFISYRRDDTEGQAGRLFDDLARSFGKDAVFMDVAAIEPGRDFRRVIDDHVASCGVLLTLLGRGWLNATNDAGARRLDDPLDFVRLETAAALKRDIPVVPVLVQGAKMPRADELPDDLKALAFRNSVELTHARWDSDVEVLITALRPYVQAQPAQAAKVEQTPQGLATPQAPAASKSRVPLYAAAGASLLALGAAFVWLRPTPPKTKDVAVATSATSAAAAAPQPVLQASAVAVVPKATAPATVKQPVVKPPVSKPTDTKAVIPKLPPPAVAPPAVQPEPTPTPAPEPKPATKPALAAKDWEGVWQLRFQYNKNWSDDKIMKVRATPSRVSGHYDIGNFSGTFSGGDYSRISGEFVNTAGTGVDCPNGKQGGHFMFTLSEDAKTMSGWWDVCGQGQKWPWKAARF